MSSLYLAVLTANVGTDSVNTVISSFTYVSDSPAPSTAEATALADVFWFTMVDNAIGIPSIVHSAMRFKSVVVTAPALETVLGIVTGDVVGLRSGQAMPRFVAAGFKSPRTRADIRQGTKRFGLVSEADVDGAAPSTGYATAIGLFVPQLNEPLDTSVGASTYTSTPAIVKRIKYAPEPGKEAYRLPNATDPLDWSIATNWVFDSITTQNSRKR